MKINYRIDLLNSISLLDCMKIITALSNRMSMSDPSFTLETKNAPINDFMRKLL